MHLSILLLFPALLLLSACTESSEPTGDASDAALGASPLQVKLDEKKAQWAADATDQTKRVYDEGIDKVDASGVIDTMKQVGDKAPAFTLPNAVGEDVSSQALLEDGPIVVVFYRGAWCPYCNITLAAWQEELETIQGLGAQLVTISPQLPDYSLDSKQKNELKFPVLSDVGNTVSDAFGITTQVTPEILEIWEGRIDLEQHNGDDSAKLPLPATYLIDQDGTIRFAHAHPDYRVRADPAEVIAELRKLSDK